MTRIFSGLLLALVLLLATSGLTAPPASALPADTTERAAHARAAQNTLKPALKAVLRKVNAARAAHDLKPMRVSWCLTRKFAQPWARHMARTEKMVHQSLSPMFRKCRGFSTVGENIAMGYSTAASVMNGWMNSPGHRENILRKGFTRIGLGLARSSDGTRYWVQDFGG